MNTRPQRTLATGLLAFAFALPTAAADFYKWVDSNGVTHYSGEPPPGAKSQQVRIEESVIPQDPAVVKAAAEAKALAAQYPSMPKYGPRNQSEASLLASDRATYRTRKIAECQRIGGVDCVREVDTELAAEGALRRPVLPVGQNPANAGPALQERRDRMIAECRRNLGVDCDRQVDTELGAEAQEGGSRVIRAPATR
jgi:hypothetical protein